jgi:hypothetical protein
LSGLSVRIHSPSLALKNGSGNVTGRYSARTERAIAKILRINGFAAAKISGVYKPGADISMPLLGVDRAVEVKCRATGFAKLYDWLDERHILIVKATARSRWSSSARPRSLRRRLLPATKVRSVTSRGARHDQTRHVHTSGSSPRYPGGAARRTPYCWHKGRRHRRRVRGGKSACAR